MRRLGTETLSLQPPKEEICLHPCAPQRNSLTLPLSKVRRKSGQIKKTAKTSGMKEIMFDFKTAFPKKRHLTTSDVQDVRLTDLDA